jgi:hypothetical protein
LIYGPGVGATRTQPSAGIPSEIADK